MARIDIKKNIIQGKIVYYGPGLCGKTTNLEYINRSSSASKELVSLATEGDRTIFFDYLPIELGKIRGINTNFKLYTVPGQVRYNLTRKMVLKNVDGVVFVADSQRLMLDSNVESLENLFSNMREIRINPDDIPVILQYNKRDLKDILSPEELDAALNPKREKTFLASAMTGEGVLETLQFVLNVVFKKIAAEFGADPVSKPKKPGQKTLLSHKVPPPPPPSRPSLDKMKAVNEHELSSSKPKKESRPVDEVGKDKSDTLQKPHSENASLSPQIKQEAAATAFGGKKDKAKADTPRKETNALDATSPSRKGDADSTVQSENKPSDSATQSVSKTKTTKVQDNEKSDIDRSPRADQKEQDTAPGDISTDIISEIRELFDKQAKEIGAQFTALNRNIEQLLNGQSKGDLGTKQNLQDLISPIQSVADSINNRLVSLTKENTLTQISSELKDIKEAFNQQSKKVTDSLLTSTEINNFRGEMARWVQESKNDAIGSANTGLSGHQINGIVERFQKELPSKTEIKEIRNAIAFLVKAAKELPSGGPSGAVINGELKTALDKLGTDAFRKEIMAELSVIKESVPSKQEQEKIHSSIALLTEKQKEDNRKKDELKNATTEIVGILQELKSNFVSKKEMTLLRQEISNIYHQMRETVGQGPQTRPEETQAVKAVERERVSEKAAAFGDGTTNEVSREPKPIAFEEPPSAPPQNETAGAWGVNEGDTSIKEVSERDESDQEPSGELEIEAQADESEEETTQKFQLSEMETANWSETAEATREAGTYEDGKQPEETSRASDENQQEENTSPSGRKKTDTDEIIDDSTDRNELRTPTEVAQDGPDSAAYDEQEPASTSQQSPPQETAVEESETSVEAKAPPEEDAEGKNALRIARVMVSDLDLYYAKDVIEGIQIGDFHERLKNQLEEMQKTFSSRVSEEVRARRDYLGEAIETFVEKKKRQLDIESNAA